MIMEECVIDVLYGDLGPGHCDSVMNHDEDSVDIYSGLENSPKINANAEKACTFRSPQKLLESLDLYEEILTEEQQEKEASYNELKSKFDAAQSQVKELILKMQKMKTQNTSLHTENTRLKKNISALIKTAKIEIVRKDGEINRLNQRSGWEGQGQSYQKYQLNCHRSQDRRRDNVAKHREDCVAKDVSKHNDGHGVAHCPSSASVDRPVSTPPLKSKCSTMQSEPSMKSKNADFTVIDPRSDSPTPKQGPAPPNTLSGNKEIQPKPAEAQVLISREGNGERLKTLASRGGRNTNNLEANKERQSKVTDRSEKAQREFERKSSKNRPQHLEGSEVLRRSERAKSPSCQTNQVTPSDILNNTVLSSQVSKGSHKDSSEVPSKGSSWDLRHLPDRDRGCRVTEVSSSKSRKEESKSYGSLTEKSSAPISRKGNKSPTRDHCRKEEKRLEDENKKRGERRSTRPEKGKEPERRKGKESDRSNQEARNIEEKRAKDKKSVSRVDVRDRRRATSPVKVGISDDSSHNKKDQEKESGRSKRKTISKDDDKQVKEKTPGTHVDSRDDGHAISPVVSDYFYPSQNDQDKENDGNKTATSKVEEKRTNDTTSGSHVVARHDRLVSSPVKLRITDNSHKKDQDKHLASTDKDTQSTVNMESDMVLERNVAEESSPNRKLSFMETLNLTLSPVKKQSQCTEGKEQDGAPSEDALEGQSAEESSQFDFGEDFCVIDEIETSQQSVEVTDEVSEESVSQPSSSAVQPDLKGSGRTSEKDGDRVLLQATGAKEKSKCSTEMEVLEEKHIKNGSECGLAAARAVHEAMTTAQEQIGKGAVSELEDSGTALKTALSSKSLNGASENHTGNSLGLMDEVMDTDNCVHSDTSKSLVSANPFVESIVTEVQDLCALAGAEKSAKDDEGNSQSESQSSPPFQSGASQEDVSTSVASHASPEKDLTKNESCVSMDAVSSTVNVDSVSQCCGNSNLNVTQVAIISSIDSEKSAPQQSPSKKPSIRVPKVSSTCRREAVLPEQLSSDSTGTLDQAPKDSSNLELDSTENAEQNTVPSSSIMLPHDEDSMMLTLKSIELIPDAISPLTSPVRPVKKIQPLCAGKPPHIKSLSKELSSATIATDTSAKRMDMNKENKKPDCSLTHTTHGDLGEAALSTSAAEDELEEGEIVSESEEEEVPVPQSSPCNKDKSATSAENQRSPRSPRLAKRAAQKPIISQSTEEMRSGPRNKTIVSQSTKERSSGQRNKTMVKASSESPSSKRRFKTVLPPSPKTSLSSIDEFMSMFKMIRMQLRKKYMKLHKNLPKKSFCSIIDMSLVSFTDFVSSINFDKLCSQGNDLKTKLHHIISSVMNKISDNGIVNRIFEQRADSLKQKLWTFVDGQFDFLFTEIQMALESVCKSLKGKSSTTVESVVAHAKGKGKVLNVQDKSPVTAVAKPKRKEVEPIEPKEIHQKNITPLSGIPYKSGLGSRGKNIKLSMEEEGKVPEVLASGRPPVPPSFIVTPTKSVSSSADKMATYVRRLSHNGSIQDKSDFEILTEQQASSLTFNLVTDSQMGEIFKCLLQGSDLLETSVSVGDNHSWPVGTPRKEVPCGEIGVCTPSKNITPSKLNTTWSSISPYKFSPNYKNQIPLNPAVLDESCLLEVPTSYLPGRIQPPTTTNYSILAEDLAVSLTIPSPLKSDSHLSFLHPANGEPLSAPDSVISAHYSEDALLDGEDATEQDIHLALDTDNSSCGSSDGRTWEGTDFHFRPHLPMQAMVTERSNDHFIVRIRRASISIATCPNDNTGGDQKETPTLAGGGEELSKIKDPPSKAAQDRSHPEGSPSQTVPVESDAGPSDKSPLKVICEGNRLTSPSAGIGKVNHTPLPMEPAKPTDNEAEEMAPDVLTVLDEESDALEIKCNGRVSKKRKKHHSAPKAKRTKTEGTQDRHHKQRHKKSSKAQKEKDMKTPTKKRSKSASPFLSPNSLSAKNVIRKKGEVVVTWTRDEDRDILIQLKMTGASTETFSALSEKINKSPAQIAERFSQLMKLFKKKEKMAS